MKIKKTIFSIISIFVLFSFVAVFSAKAVYDNGEGIVIGVRVDVSKDGTNFYNYYSGEDPGLQTLIVKPGDTLTFRGTVWNAGEFDISPVLAGEITNAQYFESIYAFQEGDEDIDGSGGVYVLNSAISLVDGAAIFDIGIEPDLKTAKNEDDPEIGQIRAVLKNDIPDQTIIEGTFLLMDVEPPAIGLPFKFFSVAHAQEALEYSYVRILVDNPSVQAADQTSPTTSPKSADLPETGPDFTHFKNFALVGIIFISAFFLLIISREKIKKELS